MKAQTIIKLTFSGLFIVALSLLFFQNSQTNTPGLGMDETTGSYASVFQSNSALRSTDNTDQSKGDADTSGSDQSKGDAPKADQPKADK